MTPNQEAMLGNAMLRTTQAEGHMAKLPPDTIKHNSSRVREQADAEARIQILECFETNEGSLPAQAISTHIGQGFARVWRCLEQLEHKGAVRRVRSNTGHGWEVVRPLARDTQIR